MQFELRENLRTCPLLLVVAENNRVPVLRIVFLQRYWQSETLKGVVMYAN